jgi:hypothetical protein
LNIRMIGLSAVVVFTVLLPFAGASAGPADMEEAATGPAGPAPGPVTKEAKGGAPADDPKALQGRAHARCGPEVVSPEGVEAQTCVLTKERDTWARTYYRNATGRDLDAVLTLMGPAGRTVRMHCAVGAEDEPGLCETPHETDPGTVPGTARGTARETPRESPRGTAEGAGAEASGEASGVARDGGAGVPQGYTAVSEFAGPQDGPLLLRSGSNSVDPVSR